MEKRQTKRQELIRFLEENRESRLWRAGPGKEGETIEKTGKLQNQEKPGTAEFPEQIFPFGQEPKLEERCCQLIAGLAGGKKLTKEEWELVLSVKTQKTAGLLFRTARRIREHFYGKRVFIRGLIEFTNYCRKDCYYCGIRRSSREAKRYRLTEKEILSACEEGYQLGFRSFVLQGGEDVYPGAELDLAETVRRIREMYPDCAVTLSVGERPKDIYRLWFQAGAERYLLRHETADEEHYRRLHPVDQTGVQRKECLRNLKEIGYQTGAGMMIGSPGQTSGHLAEDLMFLEELQPEMVGIGPFIPHHDTPFAGEKQGELELTLYVLGLVRLLLPRVLLPATTALGTIEPRGRELGLLCGANVVMPNLTPREVRENYLLYDNKLCTGSEAAEGLIKLRRSVEAIGYEIVAERGDMYGFCRKKHF